MIALPFVPANLGDPLPSFDSDSLHIWRWLVPDSGSLDDQLAVLSDAERQRVERLSDPQDRRVRMVSRSIMRRLLGQYLDCPAVDVPIRYGPLGRPHLDCPTTLNFNLSHSGQWIIMAIAHADCLGIDIELIRDRMPSDRLIARICSPREQTVLGALSDKQRRQAFFRLWTRKEAIMKATGGSVFHAPAGIDVSIGDAAQPALYQINRGSRTDWQLHHFGWDELVGAVAITAGDHRLASFTLAAETIGRW